MSANNTVPLETISRLLDVSPRRVNQLTKEGILPKTERGRYELVPVVRAYIKFLRNKAVNSDVGEGDYSSFRTKKMKADSELAEMEVRKALNNFIDKDLILKGWTEIVGAMKSKLIAIPSIIAPQLAVEAEVGTIRQILSNQINECLEELSNYDPKQLTSSNDTNNAELKSTTKTNGKQVGRPRKATIIGG